MTRDELVQLALEVGAGHKITRNEEWLSLSPSMLQAFAAALSCAPTDESMENLEKHLNTPPGYIRNALAAANPAASAQPVATVVRTHDIGGQFDWSSPPAYLPVGANLYASPTPIPADVGMTDEEIHKWWSSENGLEDHDMCKLDDFREVVRAVEKRIAAMKAKGAQ